MIPTAPSPTKRINKKADFTKNEHERWVEVGFHGFIPGRRAGRVEAGILPKQIERRLATENIKVCRDRFCWVKAVSRVEDER